MGSPLLRGRKTCPHGRDSRHHIVRGLDRPLALDRGPGSRPVNVATLRSRAASANGPEDCLYSTPKNTRMLYKRACTERGSAPAAQTQHVRQVEYNTPGRRGKTRPGTHAETPNSEQRNTHTPNAQHSPCTHSPPPFFPTHPPKHGRTRENRQLHTPTIDNKIQSQGGVGGVGNGPSFVTPRVRIREGTRDDSYAVLPTSTSKGKDPPAPSTPTTHTPYYLHRQAVVLTSRFSPKITQHATTDDQQLSLMFTRKTSPRVRNIQQVVVLVKGGVVVLLLVPLHPHRTPPPPRQLLSQRPPREAGFFHLFSPALCGHGRERGRPPPGSERLALRLDVARVRSADRQAGELHPGEVGAVQLADAVVVAAAAWPWSRGGRKDTDVQKDTHVCGHKYRDRGGRQRRAASRKCARRDQTRDRETAGGRRGGGDGDNLPVHRLDWVLRFFSPGCSTHVHTRALRSLAVYLSCLLFPRRSNACMTATPPKSAHLILRHRTGVLLLRSRACRRHRREDSEARRRQSRQPRSG